MSIDEAIVKLNSLIQLNICPNIFHEIIELLEELKCYQEQHIRMCEYHEVATVEHIYNKAIDDFINYFDIDAEHNKYSVRQIKIIAEQLKAGVKNETNI